MNLETVEIPRTGARQAAADYTRAARVEKDAEKRGELEEIARAYRYAAREGVTLIALTPTLAAGGTVVRTLVQNQWNQETKKNDRVHCHYLLPKLAVAPAGAAFVYTRGLSRDGGLQLIDRLNPWHTYKKGDLRFGPGTFERLPEGYESGGEIGSWTSSAWSSMVPLVPPKHRPARGLEKRLVLWEVESWEWSKVPPPPGDPALLRHIGGDLYAVEAVWDLTDLEKLVLAGRRQ